MNFISMFSGIEAASAAWHPLGWKTVCLSEIEKFPRAVLQHHYPHTELHGDMTQVNWSQYHGKADVVVAGAPCQAFSVAGLRKSLSDQRGNLTIKTIEAVNVIRPTYFVFENVPGILNTKDNAFGCLLAGLVGADTPLVPPGKRGRWTNAGVVAGPQRRAAWRILDAQFFGVPQRRRRVFVVACPTDGPNPAAVLFERHSLSGHPPPRRQAREETAGTLTSRAGRNGGAANDTVNAGYLIPEATHSLRPEGFDASEDGTGRGTPLVPEKSKCLNGHAVPHGRLDAESETFVVNAREHPVTASGKSLPLGAQDTGHAIATFQQNSLQGRGSLGYKEGEQALRPIKPQSDHQMLLESTMRVRRLTPVECERLQGFPDNYTRIAWRGKAPADCPDGPRYKALGNSMAVPAMAWIGKRIEEVDAL